MPRRLSLSILAAAFALAACGADDAPAPQPVMDTVFQYSTVNALLSGLYDGDMTLAELAAKGDTGLGTINGIDGELIVLDGKFYSALANGTVRELKPEDKTPFAVVAHFRPERQAGLPDGLDYKSLQSLTDQLVQAPNHLQVIRIDGTFPEMKVRSEPKQSPPYRPLAEVLEDEQVVFELENVTGSMIGFRMPSYVAGINVPGYHFHFITDDRKQGGHVLDLELSSGTIKIDDVSNFEMVLPTSAAFQGVKLGGDRMDEIDAVERR